MSVANDAQPLRPKRVCVVGAGAAGLACAWSLSEHPDQFEVHVYEAAGVAGGVSTSEDVGGGLWINDGVQVRPGHGLQLPMRLWRRAVERRMRGGKGERAAKVQQKRFFFLSDRQLSGYS